MGTTPERGLGISTDPTMSSKAAAHPDESSMSLMAHLVELRNRILICALAIAIGAVLGWFLFNPVMDLLTRPLIALCEHQKCLVSDGSFVNSEVLEPFTTRLTLSVYIGVAVAMPVLLWQLWRFVAPGLYANEKRYALAFIGPALILFLCGAWTAYYILPVSLDWLQGVGGGHFVAAYSAKSFVTLLGWMMLAFGISFEFPVVLVALMAIRLVSVRTLVRQWRYVIAGIAVFAGVITPTGDPFTFLFLAVPMVVLYGAALLIGFFMERARRSRA
jgi:sec-independent protein translocase protein TatC